jgi:hypothetical protein
MPQTLSKSRFVQGLSCPKKLVYGADKSYLNRSDEDSFLASLAQGGFQVGEFAKAHFPGGVDVKILDQQEALAQTNELLKRESVVIFEAAVQFENCFIRVDVLEKKGGRLVIHEVKAKSYDPTNEYFLIGKRGGLNSSMQQYLYDVAFQKHVVQSAFANTNVTANLMLVNKAAVCSADGLHQRYRIVREGGRSAAVLVGDLPGEILEDRLLVSVPVDHECEVIYGLTEHGDRFQGTFNALVAYLSEVCAGTEHPKVMLKKDCASCEFKGPVTSGWHECLQSVGITDPQPGELIFDLWNYRKKDDLIDQGQIRLVQLNEEDIGEFEAVTLGPELETRQRQWLQVQKVKQGDTSAWVNKPGWQQEMDEWVYPLHFIDFETTRVALPFFSGQSPYQSVAFQFSHHTLDEDGKITHANQFLLASANHHPNIEFVRKLQKSLGGDHGTIFMYSGHENTTLRDIYYEIKADQAQAPDAQLLLAFLKSIVQPSKDSAEKWSPERPMVDLLELIKKHLYLPATNGSNSLKAVLPAIMNESAYLKSHYSEPVYGVGQKIPSLNIGPRAWIQVNEEGKVENPYDSLPDLSHGMSEEERAQLAGIDSIKDGGAALTAYSRLMFEDLPPEHRESIEQGLKEYCELDTLAMVFLYQGIKDLLER